MDKNNYSFTSYHIGENGDISYKTILLDEDRRDRRMTIEELLEEIKQQGAILEELKKQIEALSDDEKKIRTLPINGEKYTFISGELTYDFEQNYPCFFDTSITKENSSIGNYFKSKEDAEMVIRAMQLEQAIRIRRIELNDGWEPNWDDVFENKFFISNEEYIYVDRTLNNNYLPVFGYYESDKFVRQIIDEFKDDLLWYFTEYYPNRDKMYVWGD